jgi:hypothetical protein
MQLASASSFRYLWMYLAPPEQTAHATCISKLLMQLVDGSHIFIYYYIA